MNPLSLSFSEPLESEYRRKNDERMRLITGIALTTSLLVYLLMSYTDSLVAPELSSRLHLYRFAFFAPILLALTILTLLPALKKYHHAMISVWCITLFIQILNKAVIIGGSSDTPFVTSLIVISLMSFAVFRLRFPWVLITLLSSAALFFFFTGFWNLLNRTAFLFAAFYYIATVIIGIVTSYMMEKFDRRCFLASHLTAQTQQRIADENSQLEMSLKEHSQQLKDAAEEMKREKEVRELSVEALVSSDEKYRDLFENSGYPIIVFEPDNSLIIDINKSGIVLFEYGDDTIGQRFDSFFSDLYERDEIFQLLTDSGNVKSHEVKLAVKSGEILHCLVSIRPRKNDSGSIEYYQAVVTDISERIKLQEQFIQAQKMESIGRLAGGVAHDFNNLLTALLGYSDFALMTIPEDDPSYGYFIEIKATADRAANLTRQLLTFSRRQIIEPKVILLNETLFNMDKMLRRLIGEDIELAIIPNENLWYVMMDSGQMEQVITNIVVNARDAMPDGGKIIIESANITIDSRNPCDFHGIGAGDFASLTITDNGCGMDEETLSHIFEPFFTTKEEGKGTGLGLSTSYGIVDQNDGGIFFKSDEGKGTVVTLLLPRSFEAPAAEALKVALDDIPGGAETVLIVEDEATVRRMVNRVLSRQGYQVIEADNGEEALRVFDRESAGKISLVITDVIMPRMGGKELSEHIAVKAPNLKVLFMSGYTDESILTGDIIDKGLAFMKKPFSPADLLAKVRGILDEV